MIRFARGQGARHSRSQGQRLQRELTQRFFLANNDKVLITFSAGVAQVHASETGMAALQRADQAMYLAKRNGKNRVIAA